ATKTAFLSILPAAILTAFYIAYEIPSFIGQFALNLPMPVTLWMLYQCLPDAPGLSFGLAASALFPGTLIGQLITLTDRSQWFFILLSFLFGIVAITISEKRLNKKKGEEI
ncbi:MAG: hypothetical protein IJ091_06695, partial [Oscillospiraceae bacterium]|nr:hypothetical protein [Oscillospiraceae bacterium]